MKTSDFLDSNWMKMARAKGAEKKVRKEFDAWVQEVKDTKLVKRGRQLWDRLNSGNVSTAEKLVIIAALLYLISPVDLISDAIPVLGWLDDLGVAGIALNYVLRRVDEERVGKNGRSRKGGKGKKNRPKSPQEKLVKAVRRALT